MRKSLLRCFLIYTTVALFLCLIAHVSLYFGFNCQKAFPTLWLMLHLSIIVGYIPLPFLYEKNEQVNPKEYTAKIPKVLLPIVLLFMLAYPYALFNFVYCNDALKEGYPDTVNGEQVLVLPHGQRPRKLTEEEYAQAELYQARKTSGHWMLCHMIPCIFLYEKIKWGAVETKTAI
jgi:hypothetical protein